MDNHLLQIIKETTAYIENNLLEPLNLDSISENVNITKFHLLRIWKGATSTGLMEYVRRRRLAQSLSDLLNHRNSIDFISSRYSFGCERTYNRAFKEEYGTTPAKWRSKPNSLNILDRFNADFMNVAGDGLIFLRSITIMPPFTLSGPEYRIAAEGDADGVAANSYAVDFFYNGRLRIINPIEKDVYIGYSTAPEEARGVYTLYQPSIQTDLNSIIPPDMKTRRIKPHRYGVFTYMGLHRPEEISAKYLRSIWQYVAEVWMPTIQFNLDEAFHFERVNYAKCNKQYCECDLYYPISTL